MGIPRPAPPALLVAAVTVNPSSVWTDVCKGLTSRWGSLLEVSESYDFDSFTDYYAPEMGTGLTKRLVVFRDAVHPEALAALKIASNALEAAQVDIRGGRRVNIDPGYLTPEAFILASTKPAGYRICLRDGIYGEITLRYEFGAYAPLPWTYPDFRQPMVRKFLGKWRRTALDLQKG